MDWRGGRGLGGRELGRSPQRSIVDYFRGQCCGTARGAVFGRKRAEAGGDWPLPEPSRLQSSSILAG